MTVEVAGTTTVLPGVVFEGRAVVEDWCVSGSSSGKGTPPATTVGDGAVIHSHTAMCAGNRIGRNFSTGNKANIRENNEIGDNVSVDTMAVVAGNPARRLKNKNELPYG